MGQHLVSGMFASGAPELAKARMEQLLETRCIGANDRLVQRNFEGAKLTEQLKIHGDLPFVSSRQAVLPALPRCAG
jgi:hypothetical protein